MAAEQGAGRLVSTAPRRTGAASDAKPGRAAATAPRWPWVVGMVLTVVGLGLASYLTWAHFQPAGTNALACPTNGVINCQAVTTSRFATVMHVPVAVAGLAFFVVMLPLQLPAAWRSPNPWVHRARLVWAAIGTLSVFWLVYVELFQLDKICEYCTGVHLMTIALFAVSALGAAAMGSADSATEFAED